MTVVASMVAVLAPGGRRIDRAFLLAALVAPLPTALVVAVLAVRAARRGDVTDTDTNHLTEIASGLRSGRTLRDCVAAVDPEVARLVEVGAGSHAVAAALGHVIPRRSDAIAAAFVMLDESGGPAAEVFEELAVQSSEEARVRRELRAAVAAPMLQGVVLAGIPVVILLHMLVAGRVGAVVSRSSVHAASVGLGALFTVLGVVWVWWILRRAVR